MLEAGQYYGQPGYYPEGQSAGVGRGNAQAPVLSRPEAIRLYEVNLAAYHEAVRRRERHMWFFAAANFALAAALSCCVVLSGCAVAGAAVSVTSTAVSVGAGAVGLAADAAIGTARLAGKGAGAAIDAFSDDKDDGSGLHVRSREPTGADRATPAA